MEPKAMTLEDICAIYEESGVFKGNTTPIIVLCNTFGVDIVGMNFSDEQLMRALEITNEYVDGSLQIAYMNNAEGAAVKENLFSALGLEVAEA